eukprot:7580992-Pyramimonas_sp.AAC.1
MNTHTHEHTHTHTAHTHTRTHARFCARKLESKYIVSRLALTRKNAANDRFSQTKRFRHSRSDRSRSRRLANSLVAVLWMLRAIVRMLRAIVRMLRAILWMVRAIVRMVRAIVRM